MKKVLFLDRDGTLVLEPPDEQLDQFEKVEFLPSVFQYLGKIVRELDYELVMVTNQDGLGTDSFPEEDFWPIHNLILKAFTSEGIDFQHVFIDRSFPAENLPSRKPGTAMLSGYISNVSYDLVNSFVIGDRESDVELATNLGAKSIFISENASDNATYTCSTWKSIYEILKSQDRLGAAKQNTSETRISINLNLDGSGVSVIQTGIAFFDHMLDQLSKHGGIDLAIRVVGDLNVDEHHTIEDTAIALGSAFREALGKKSGIERYGFLLPMDDCLAQVAIDFGGRPWLEWDASFKREKVGEMPTEMFYHFFKSFSDSARCNLNIQATGENEHHKIEAIFKGFARAIRMAIGRNSDEIPSTKGTL